MTLDLYLAYLLASLLIAVIPGPMVTLVIANSLAHGTRAGLLNVAGGQLALGLILAVLLFGLASAMATLGVWFEWVRFAGAVYLVWMGWKMLRSAGFALPGQAPTPRGGFFLQGFLVMLSNPKVLLFFSAFLPQFIDPQRDQASQLLLLGVTAMAIATLSDGMYAVLSGRAGALLSRRRVRLLSQLSGGFLIGGGLWLAATRAR